MGYSRDLLFENWGKFWVQCMVRGGGSANDVREQGLEQGLRKITR